MNGDGLLIGGRPLKCFGFSDSLTAQLRCIPVEVEAARIPLNRYSCCCCACGDVCKALRWGIRVGF